MNVTLVKSGVLQVFNSFRIGNVCASPPDVSVCDGALMNKASQSNHGARIHSRTPSKKTVGIHHSIYCSLTKLAAFVPLSL